MRRKDKAHSSWQRRLTFPQKFSYELDAPIEDVVRSLADLEQEPRLFRRTSDEVSVLPAGDDYFFRLRVRRHGTLTLNAEGRVWQDDKGCVIVEGETQINAWASLAGFGMMLVIGVWTALATSPVLLIPFILSVMIGMWSNAAIYKRDRRRVLQRLDHVINEAASRSTGKLKRSEASLALHNSVWDGALTDEHGDERRRNRERR